MPDATTPRLSLVQPEVGASASTWGFKWNNNATILDDAITTAGGEIAGSLTVDGTLIMQGPAYANTSFTVDGTLIMEGAAYANSSLSVSSLTVLGPAHADGNALLVRALSGGTSSLALIDVPANAAMGMWLEGPSPYQLNFGATDGSGTPFNNAMYIRDDGTLLINGQGWKPGGGLWADASDARLKKDIVDYTSGLAEICALHPVSYRYNGLAGTKNDGRVHHGLIAQEVETIMPELVGTRRARLNPDDQTYADILTLDPTPAFFALINAVRELAGRVRALETTFNPTGES